MMKLAFASRLGVDRFASIIPSGRGFQFHQVTYHMHMLRIIIRCMSNDGGESMEEKTVRNSPR